MRLLPLALAVCATLGAAVPKPAEHLGFEPGADYKLANYAELIGYFQKLAAASDRIRLVEFGTSSLGRPMYVALLSDAENLKALDRYREISRRLALGQASADEARQLSREGKAIVWIDSGLHSTEVAPSQHAPELAWRMVSQEDEETRRIRRNVILMQVPCINPDGLDMVVEWYRKNVGTPYELAPLPFLYQKYAGHDNNRDWFMMNLPETRAVSRLLFREWLPQIVYNQHQAPPFPARIFVPPYAEPLNPHIPAPVMEGINLIGAAMKERFARENKPGVLSYWGFDAWWNGGLRSAPAFHNMHGILTETALHGYGTPRDYKPSDLPERFGNGMPAREPSVFYQRPWLGGKWGTREAIEYMLTADFAILDLAASRAPEFLLKAWEMARANVEAARKSVPFAYLVPSGKNDAAMLARLALAGIDVHRAVEPLQVNGRSYPAGTHVLYTAQPFRPYLADLMEPQRYPEIRTGATGPPKRPYDVAGWTLWMSMGVEIDRTDAPFTGKTQRVEIDFPESAPAGPSRKRVGVYEPWTANMDAGWTQWTLDYLRIPYSLIHNDEFRKPGLRERFDTIVLSSQSTESILHGHKDGERTRRGPASGDSPALQRPEYTGGIGVQGLAELERFVRDGGTLVTLDAASDLPVRLFGLPLRPAVAGDNWASPGSLLRLTTDTPGEVIYAFSTGGQAWDVSLEPEYNKDDREVKVVARYAAKNLLASGWIAGERTVAGKAAMVEARYGKGRVVLFGFRPQFRGQTFGTFPLLVRAIAGW